MVWWSTLLWAFTLLIDCDGPSIWTHKVEGLQFSKVCIALSLGWKRSSDIFGKSFAEVAVVDHRIWSCNWPQMFGQHHLIMPFVSPSSTSIQHGFKNILKIPRSCSTIITKLFTEIFTFKVARFDSVTLIPNIPPKIWVLWNGLSLIIWNVLVVFSLQSFTAAAYRSMKFYNV